MISQQRSVLQREPFALTAVGQSSVHREPHASEGTLPDFSADRIPSPASAVPADALALVRLLSEGDLAAFSWLCDELRPRLLCLALQRSRQLGDPEDLVSDFLLERCLEGRLPARMRQAFERSPGGGRARVLGYACGSFKNWLNDRGRRQVAPTLSLEDLHHEPVAAPQSNDDETGARRGLSLIAFACESWFSGLKSSMVKVTLSERRQSILFLVSRLELVDRLARAERAEEAKKSVPSFPRRRPQGLPWSQWVERLLPWSKDEESLPVEPYVDLKGAWVQVGSFLDHHGRKPNRAELARLVGGPSANALDKRLCYARQALDLPRSLFSEQRSA
ncbi:MAG: hypothetical protein JKY65_06040 [Planctomycetes bacterium]|nr:hypothetical protein [Planctomycetota bacterium]